MFRRILILLGETPSSISARHYALAMARSAEAELAGMTGLDLPYIEAVMPGRVGASAYGARLQGTLRQQAQDIGREAREQFDGECRAHAVPFEIMSFEGDPIEALCAAAELSDLVVTGHDTAFRGKVHEQLSDMLSKLLLITPRPIVICPDKLSGSDDVLVAYDGSLSAMRAVQMFALLALRRDRFVQVVSIQSDTELAAQRTARAVNYLRRHGYQVEGSSIASRLRPAEVLQSEIRGRNVGTVVMGAYGHRGFRERLFGSTTSTLVENPPCALFLYH